MGQCQGREENVVRIMQLKAKEDSENDMEAALKQIFEDESPGIIAGSSTMANMCIAVDDADALVYMTFTSELDHEEYLANLDDKWMGSLKDYLDEEGTKSAIVLPAPWKTADAGMLFTLVQYVVKRAASKEHFKKVWKEALPQIDPEKLKSKPVNNQSTVGFTDHNPGKEHTFDPNRAESVVFAMSFKDMSEVNSYLSDKHLSEIISDDPRSSTGITTELPEDRTDLIGGVEYYEDDEGKTCRESTATVAPIKFCACKGYLAF